MPLDKNEVKYVARLARIALEEKILPDFTRQLDKILSYMDKLNQLDTKDTPATSHVQGLTNVFRKDVLTPCPENAEALNNAPDKENGHFKVPKII